jgi:hypothetical protein
MGEEDKPIEICERNGCPIYQGDDSYMIYGALWCAACADDRDQYDKPEDYNIQRGYDQALEDDFNAEHDR